MNSFRRVIRSLRTSSRTSEKKLGLRASPLFILHQLAKYEPLSVNELADRTFSHQSTVSIILEDLVKRGYVNRGVAEQDRRRLELTLTPQGRLLAQKKITTIQEQLAVGLMKMSEKKRKQLAHLLEEFILSAGLNNETPHFFLENEIETKSQND